MKRKLPITAVLLGSVVLSIGWKMIPLKDASARLASIATHGSGLSSREIPISSNEEEKLRGAQAIKRLYSYEGTMFSVSCVDGTGNRNAVHDPSYCLIARGWEVKDHRELALNNGCGSLITLESGDKTTEILYWFSRGTHSFHSMPRYWFESTFRRLTRGCFSSEPIQVVVQPYNHSGQFDWNDFAEIILPMLNIR